MIRRTVLPLGPVDRREVLRYAGAKNETPELAQLLDEAAAELTPLLTGQVCWMEFPLIWKETGLDLGFAVTDSSALRRNLAGCGRIVLFAATIGLGPDRLMARYGAAAPAKALLVQAIGAERIEALCDAFCQTLGKEAGPRFSPGYGDLPLSLQADIFRVLDCQRQIGLTLNKSLLMSPSKSVTAIVGLGDPVCGTAGCRNCGKKDCLYRRNP